MLHIAGRPKVVQLKIIIKLLVASGWLEARGSVKHVREVNSKYDPLRVDSNHIFSERQRWLQGRNGCPCDNPIQILGELFIGLLISFDMPASTIILHREAVICGNMKSSWSTLMFMAIRRNKCYSMFRWKLLWMQIWTTNWIELSVGTIS